MCFSYTNQRIFYKMVSFFTLFNVWKYIIKDESLCLLNSLKYEVNKVDNTITG